MTVITAFYLYKAHFSMLVYIFNVEYWVILYGTIHSRLTWLFIQCAKLFLPSMSVECDTDIMISQLVNLNNCSVSRDWSFSCLHSKYNLSTLIKINVVKWGKILHRANKNDVIHRSSKYPVWLEYSIKYIPG